MGDGLHVSGGRRTTKEMREEEEAGGNHVRIYPYSKPWVFFLVDLCKDHPFAFFFFFFLIRERECTSRRERELQGLHPEILRF